MRPQPPKAVIPAKVDPALFFAIKKMTIQGNATVTTEVDRRRQQRWARMQRTSAMPRQAAKMKMNQRLKTRVEVTVKHSVVHGWKHTETKGDICKVFD